MPISQYWVIWVLFKYLGKMPLLKRIKRMFLNFAGVFRSNSQPTQAKMSTEASQTSSELWTVQPKISQLAQWRSRIILRILGHYGALWGIMGRFQKGYFKIHSGKSHSAP